MERYRSVEAYRYRGIEGYGVYKLLYFLKRIKTFCFLLVVVIQGGFNGFNDSNGWWCY